MPDEPAPLPETTDAIPSAPVVQAGDYYFDGPWMVFTADYHRQRGFCCGNDCRHCPYDAEGNFVTGKGELPA